MKFIARIIKLMSPPQHAVKCERCGLAAWKHLPRTQDHAFIAK